MSFAGAQHRVLPHLDVKNTQSNAHPVLNSGYRWLDHTLEVNLETQFDE